MTRPDRSGRVTERRLLRVLHWSPGHCVDIHVDEGMLLVASAGTGRQTVGSRGELLLPGSARRMCGIVPEQPVLLAALVAQDLLVIHPASTVGRLLTDLHTRLPGGRHAG
jgi:hypothetical protein